MGIFIKCLFESFPSKSLLTKKSIIKGIMYFKWLEYENIIIPYKKKSWHKSICLVSKYETIKSRAENKITKNNSLLMNIIEINKNMIMKYNLYSTKNFITLFKNILLA